MGFASTTSSASNFSSVDSVETSDYQNAEGWDTVINVCEGIYPIQAFFGISGNIINLFVLFSKNMKGRTPTLLSLVAFADILFLCLLSIHYLGRYGFMIRSYNCIPNSQTSCTTWFYSIYIHVKPHLTFGINLFSLASSWLIVTVCFDRLWAIRTPLHCHGGRCSKGMFCCVVAICLLSVGLTAFHNFAFKVVPNNSTQYNVTGMNNGIHLMQPSPYQLPLKILAFLEVCFQIIVPMILLVISNSLLLYYLRNRSQHFQVQRWNASKNSFDSFPSNDNGDENRSSKIWSRRHSTTERKITTTVFCIVCCYIVTNLPSGILFIFIYIIHSGIWYKTKQDYALFVLSNCIVVFGKMANFFLLCNSSTYFRRQLYKQCFEKLCSFRRRRAQTPRVHYAKLERVDFRP